MTLSNPLQIIQPQDPRWFAFIETQPDAVIFHHPVWINVLALTYHYSPFILTHCSQSGEILAGLPMMEVKSPFTGRRWVSLPFSDYCKPLAIDETALQEFTQRLADLGNQADTPRIELRWQFPPQEAIKAYKHHVLHLNHLEPDFDIVFNKIHKRMRKHIRQVEKNNLRVEVGVKPQDVHKFYQLQLETRRRHGVPVQPRKFFDLLGTQVLEKGLGFILTAYHDDQLLSGLVLLHYQNTVTLKYSADTRDYDKFKPNYLMDISALRWAHENGYQIVDYGRSALDNTGLRDYKTRLGATEIPLIYGVIGNDPPDGTEGKLAIVMKTIIQHSPPFVCRAAGEILYRHVG